MQNAATVAPLCVLLFAPDAWAASEVSYKVNKGMLGRNVTIQSVAVDAAAGMGRKAVKRVNAALAAASTGFAREARECGQYAQGHPWGYDLKADKLVRTHDYLGVVYNKMTVCAGSPNIEKDTRVFSMRTGAPVPPRVLVGKMFPDARLRPTVRTDKTWIHLDEDTIDEMIEDSRVLLGVYDERCEFYLKNAAYRVWPDGDRLVLFPEFIQPESFCQQEYVLRAADPDPGRSPTTKPVGALPAPANRS